MRPYYTAPDVTLYHADVRDGLAVLPERSAHLVLTSPPYWGLRRYSGVPDDIAIGNEKTPDEYVSHLVDVFRRVRRVLRDDGVLVLNLGDSYAGSWGNYAPGGIVGKQRPRTEQGQRWERPAYGDMTYLPATANVQGIAPKNLIEMPSRVVLALQADGWVLRSRVVWVKRSCLPESVTDRPTTATEYLFLLSKASRYHWDQEAVRREHVRYWNPETNNPGQIAHIGKRWANGYGQRPPRGFTESPNLSGRNFRNTDCYFDSLDLLIAEQRRYLAHLEAVRRDGGLLLDEDGDPLALDVCPAGFKDAHFATFPTDLVRPWILAATGERACSKCGRQWVRMVERKGGTIGKGSWVNHSLDMTHGRTQSDGGVRDSDHHENYSTMTLGFRAACSCSAGAVPAVVLDPFAGSGTTLLVARQLGRHSIGIEASEEYAAMAARRLEAQTPALPIAPEPTLPGLAEPEQQMMELEVDA